MNLYEHPVLRRNKILRALYEDEYVVDRHGRRNDQPIVSAVPLYDGILLYEIVRRFKPERTLEVGMAYGASTLFICEGHRDNGAGGHVAVDLYQEATFDGIGLLNVERCGFKDMVTFHHRSSAYVLPELAEQGERFGFVFIDGDHMFDSVMIDFYYADRLIDEGGLILFHDLHMPAVRKVLSFVLRNKGYALEESVHPVCPGRRARLARLAHNIRATPLEPKQWPYYSLRAPWLSALVRKVSGDTRPWHHYASF